MKSFISENVYLG